MHICICMCRLSALEAELNEYTCLASSVCIPVSARGMCKLYIYMCIWMTYFSVYNVCVIKYIFSPIGNNSDLLLLYRGPQSTPTTASTR